MPTIRIKGMSCQHCVASVTKALADLDGVTGVVVNLQSGEAQFNEEQPIDAEEIKNAIARIGFEVL